VRSVIRRVLGVALALLVVASIAAPGAIAGKKGATSTHKPRYKKGPSGGDDFNYIHQDAKAGQVAVFRLFPGVSPIVGCEPEPSAGWAMLSTEHHVDGPVSTVTVSFDAVLDPYAWLMVAVRDGRGWLGVKKLQGPHAGAGRLKVKLFRHPHRGSKITIEFGVQLGDACPQVGEAVAEFKWVKVR
jgi:hypothetical protein